ncbi:MAG: FG-GAP repeat protein [Deltaproteobacteria bacterium ADurb.Bin151]|nr:MAG: FG-GAP repeat protein [Deltaproteobacteria bacterium ADurb.Bin151]
MFKIFTKAVCLLLLAFFLTNCGGGGDGGGVGVLPSPSPVSPSPVPLSTAKAITAFSLAGVVGAIDETQKTIVVFMPFGTDVTTLVATFTTTGANVTVGFTLQISGTTANNFSSPVVYTVTADDATTQDYTVTVMPSLPLTLIPISFSGDIIPYDWYHPVLADLNNDGFIEALGTFNDRAGNLIAASPSSMGLGSLFIPGRIQRTCAAADFNGDGLPDIVCNVFSSYEVYTNPDPDCQASNAGNPYSPNSVAMLFFNNGDGTFTENIAFRDLKLRGIHGETILVADFNNDDFLDIFWPQATACSPNEQNYLLINDGNGNFTEVADEAGVAMRNTAMNFRGEGAQAIDFNLDGWIDFYVGSHLFINNGVKNGKLTFTDQRAALGLPLASDEGIKFTDWNNDGHLDLVIHHPYTGPTLYQFNGTSFEFKNIIPPYSFSESYGLNIFDMNNDGREDIIVSGGTNVADIPNPTVVWLNNGTGFERANPTAMDAWGQDTISFADINLDGRLDILKRDVGGLGLAYFKNSSSLPKNSFFKIDVRGPAGERNQQGRIVKIYPLNHPDVIFTRFVDSGSGYLTQSPYEIFIGTPYTEPHNVEVYYRGGIVKFTINPGNKKRVYPDGMIVNY